MFKLKWKFRLKNKNGNFEIMRKIELYFYIHTRKRSKEMLFSVFLFCKTKTKYLIYLYNCIGIDISIGIGNINECISFPYLVPKTKLKSLIFLDSQRFERFKFDSNECKWNTWIFWPVYSDRGDPMQTICVFMFIYTKHV